MYDIVNSEKDILNIILDLARNSRRRSLINRNMAVYGGPTTTDDFRGDRHDEQRVPMNIVTRGKWSYPALVEVILSVAVNGKPSANIVVCRRQAAKRLVYLHNSIFVEKFDRDILNSNSFHLINRNNVNSYVNATSDRFYNELIEERIDASIDNDTHNKSCETLLYKLRNSKYPYLVSTVNKNSVKNGRMVYGIVYSLITLNEASRLVYWHKKHKKSNERSKFDKLTHSYAIEHAVAHSDRYRYARIDPPEVERAEDSSEEIENAEDFPEEVAPDRNSRESQNESNETLAHAVRSTIGRTIHGGSLRASGVQWTIDRNNEEQDVQTVYQTRSTDEVPRERPHIRIDPHPITFRGETIDERLIGRLRLNENRTVPVREEAAEVAGYDDDF